MPTMPSNNGIGTVNPIHLLAGVVHKRGALSPT